MNRTDVLSEGSPQWYEAKINQLQDWLLDKSICADALNVEIAYKEVLHKVIDMFDGVNTDFVSIREYMDEWM